jgi:hypothetical protein
VTERLCDEDRLDFEAESVLFHPREDRLDSGPGERLEAALRVPQRRDPQQP